MPIIGSVGGSYGYGRAGGGSGVIVTVEAWGAGGGPGTPGGWSYGGDGGGGGYSYGVFEVFNPTSLKIITGRQGYAGDWWGSQSDSYLGTTTYGASVEYGSGGGATNSNSDNRYSGGGGGFSGVFVDSVHPDNTLLIAGGGGGGSASYVNYGGSTNVTRGGAGGGIMAQSGVITQNYRDQGGYSFLPDGTSRKGVVRRSRDSTGMYSSGANYRDNTRFYGGTTFSNSYGGGGGGGWVGGDAGGYYDVNPHHQMGGGAGGSSYYAGAVMTYPDHGMEYNRQANWFSAGYFGVMTGTAAGIKLTNGATYNFANMASPGNNNGTSSYQIWLMMVEYTSGTSYRTHWAGLFNLPNGSNSGPVTMVFDDAISEIGSRTIPSTGDYYIAWLSGNGFASGGNPQNSLWGYNGNDTASTDVRTSWIVWSSISGGAAPSVDKVYTTNDGGGGYTVSLAYGGHYEGNIITANSGSKIKTVDYQLRGGQFTTPGYTSGNYPGGGVGYGAPDNNNNSGNGRGYVRVVIDGTTYTYDYATSGGSIQTINF